MANWTAVFDTNGGGVKKCWFGVISVISPGGGLSSLCLKSPSLPLEPQATPTRSTPPRTPIKKIRKTFWENDGLLLLPPIKPEQMEPP